MPACSLKPGKLKMPFFINSNFADENIAVDSIENVSLRRFNEINL